MDLESKSEGEFACATAVIGPDKGGQRIQEALVGLFSSWLPSRKSCRKAIDRGEVWCNGKPAVTALRVNEGDQIQYKPSPADVPNPGPVAAQTLNIIRPEAADFAFVWKPAGIATSGSGLHNLAAIIAFQSQKNKTRASKTSALKKTFCFNMFSPILENTSKHLKNHPKSNANLPLHW